MLHTITIHEFTRNYAKEFGAKFSGFVDRPFFLMACASAALRLRVPVLASPAPVPVPLRDSRITVHNSSVTFSLVASLYIWNPGARGLVLNSSGHELEELPLIEAAQNDPSRFAELYEIHFERVYAYITRRVQDRSEAQDLTSHVFHQALANLGKFKWRGAPFAAWLFRIAANSIADRSRRLAMEHSPVANLQPPAASRELDLEQVERSTRLFKLVNQLPADQRKVILLRFADEKSIGEIASELGRTEGAVKQLQFRGLENLRARLSDR